MDYEITLREYECGCKITTDRYPSIVYCSKHKAAPRMHRALMEFPHYITASNMDADQILYWVREWRHKYWQPAVEGLA